MDHQYQKDFRKIFLDTKKDENSLVELELFLNKHEGSEEVRNNKMLFLLRKSDIFSNLDRFDEAIQIIETLLKESVKSNAAFFNLLSAKIDICVKMGKTKKAKILIGECLKGEMTFNENENLIFLQKLEELCAPQLINQKYNTLIQHIIYFLGFKDSTVGLSINEVVRLVYNANFNSAKAYTKLMIELHSTDLPDNKVLVEEYIKTEKLDYYRQMALAL
jgi:hypothetical protein